MDEFLFSVMAAIAVTLAVDAVRKFNATMDSVQSYVDAELKLRATVSATANTLEAAIDPKGDNGNG